jgi:hypothetical protein
MTGHDSDPLSEVRRHETIAGSHVTIIRRGNVETVRGGPKCRWCSKPLRPKYQTQRAPHETHHYFEKQPTSCQATFDEKRNQWLVASIAFRIVCRTFEGLFGAYADNHFCGLNCGRDYALAVIERLSSRKLRLVDSAGKEVELRLREK